MNELVKIDSTLHRAVKIEAAKDGVSMKVWISQLIEKELTARKKAEKSPTDSD